MYISRYAGGDPEYRAIYGLTICEGRSDPAMLWLTVWGADRPPAASGTKPAAAGTEVPDRRLDPSSFDDSYRVGATSGSQFGIGSTIVLSENGTRVTITDALGRSVPVPESLTFDMSTDSVHGVTPVHAVTHLWSLATYQSRKYIYGLSLEAPALSLRGDGWPEQAGACGAEEEPDPEAEPDT